MRVLLLKDVYKLGHAGDIKKVADGYGRNFLIPQRLATLATAAAVKQAETLRQNAAIARANRRLPDYARVRSFARPDPPFTHASGALTACAILSITTKNQIVLPL